MVLLHTCPSFKSWAPEEKSGDNGGCLSPHYYHGNGMKLGSSLDLDAAAVRIQKIYKGYRTRRSMADCAVVVQKLW